MPSKLWIAAASVSLLLTSRPALAHHSFAAEFDAHRPVKLTGAIAKIELVNPHAWILIDVKASGGKVEQWMVEGGTPNTLRRRGIGRDTIKVGTVIVVEGYRAKDGSLRVNGRNMTLPDGRTLFLGSSGTDAPRDDGDTTEK